MPITDNEAALRMVENISTMRSEFLTQLLDPRRDIDQECGYPKVVDVSMYRMMYDREGVAQRVVNLFPQESWAVDPEIYEVEDQDDTEWEVAWQALDDRHQCLHFLQRVDELSGVGHFGVLLLGLDDGLLLSEPAVGINERGEAVGGGEQNLIYIRAFDEYLVDIVQYEIDPTNPRYGFPTMYDLKFYDPRTNAAASTAGETGDTTTRRVHWSRIIHVADNRTSSEVLGVPRMRPVFNRLYDLRKLLGGSAEMFWKGAFPGYSFEVNPDLDGAVLDTEAMRAEFASFSNGLQRYLALAGVTAKSLAVQVADPDSHIAAQLQDIAITLGVPLRVFMGSEQAQLASAQDSRSWNKRLARRQRKYLSPLVIRPFIDRLMALGILPTIKKYFVDWPDLDSPTDDDKATVAAKRTEALAKYVAGGVDALIPPLEFLTVICGMSQDEAEAIMDAAIEHIMAANPDADPADIVPPRMPTPPELDEPGPITPPTEEA